MHSGRAYSWRARRGAWLGSAERGCVRSVWSSRRRATDLERKQMAEIEKKGLEIEGTLDGSGMRVGIVHTRWNADVVNALVSGAEEQLV